MSNLLQQIARAKAEIAAAQAEAQKPCADTAVALGILMWEMDFRSELAGLELELAGQRVRA